MASALLAILLGIAVGLVAAAPYGACLRAARPSVSRGVVALALSFSLLTAVVVLVRATAPRLLLPFAVPAVLSFLSAVLVGASRDVR